MPLQRLSALVLALVCGVAFAVDFYVESRRPLLAAPGPVVVPLDANQACGSLGHPAAAELPPVTELEDSVPVNCTSRKAEA